VSIVSTVADFWASSSYSEEYMDIRCTPSSTSPMMGLRLWRGRCRQIIADIEFSGDVPWRHESKPTSMLTGALEYARIRLAGPAICHRIKGNSGSPEVMEMLKSWDSYCRSNHSCSLGSDLRQLPTRVIDVGSPDGSHGSRLFIPRVGKGHI